MRVPSDRVVQTAGVMMRAHMRLSIARTSALPVREQPVAQLLIVHAPTRNSSSS